MSVTALTNIPEPTSTQPIGKSADAAQGVQPVPSQPVGATSLPEDSFTPSAQDGATQSTAQQPGLFQVSQVALSSATAVIQPNQTALPQATQNAVPAQFVQTGTDDIAPAEVTAATANVQTQASPPAPATTAANVVTLGEPQTLNATLLGLGLSNSDIQYIDRIASSINNYNPTVYNDLVQQFQTQAAQQSAAAAASLAPATQPKIATP